MAEHNYTADSIKSLDWKEHIRLRPGMYIGKLGDGSSEDDGIYVLLKEVIDNSIDEFVMGFGKQIEVDSDGHQVTIRDFGRGIPLEKLLDCSSKINTGAKYDSEAFKKSVGLNGVGIKAVNALSTNFEIQSFREGETRRIEYACGDPQSIDKKNKKTKEENGTVISYLPMIRCSRNFVIATSLLSGCYGIIPTSIKVSLFVLTGKGFVRRRG